MRTRCPCRSGCCARSGSSAAATASAAARLSAQESYAFFAALGDLLITGPTRTNVNDLRIALVD